MRSEERYRHTLNIDFRLQNNALHHPILRITIGKVKFGKDIKIPSFCLQT
jgi:hypothetical protein